MSEVSTLVMLRGEESDDSWSKVTYTPQAGIEKGAGFLPFAGVRIYN